MVFGSTDPFEEAHAQDDARSGGPEMLTLLSHIDLSIRLVGNAPDHSHTKRRLQVLNGRRSATDEAWLLSHSNRSMLKL